MTTRPQRDALQRIIEAFLAGCVLLLAGTAVLSRLQHAQLEDATQRADQSRRTVAVVEGVGHALGDAEAAVHGYLLTGQASAVGEYLAAVTTAERALADLEKDFDGGADQPAAFRRLQALGTQKLAGLARVVSMQGTQLEAAALQNVRSSEARQATADIRAVVKTMLAREQALLADREAAARTERDRARHLSWLTELGAGLFIAGAAAWAHGARRARTEALDALATSRRELEASERRVEAMAHALPAPIGCIGDTETSMPTARCRAATRSPSTSPTCAATKSC